MKKIVGVFLFAIVMLLNINLVHAELDMQCDPNSQINGKLLKKCTLIYVADSANPKNEIAISLIPDNAKILSYNVNVTDNNWSLVKKENNGFKLHSKTNKIADGRYNLAVLEIENEKIESDKKCEIEVKYEEFFILKQCKYDETLNVWYGKFGDIVEESEYIEECLEKETPKCEKVGDKYYDDTGNEVTETNYKLLCYKCRIKDNKYYDLTGTETTLEKYKQQCEKNVCKQVGDKYYDKNGNEVSESEYKETCFEKETPKCEKVGDTYYDKDGKTITEEVYKINCLEEKPVCKIVDNKYYNKNGVEVSEKEYKKSCFSCKKPTEGDNNYYDKEGNVITKEKYKSLCEEIDNPKTAVLGSLIPITIGILLLIMYNIINKKRIIERV